MQHLYISYPPNDKDLAHQLVDDLQGAGYAVFIDPVSETATMSWAVETRRAIRTCGALVMILAPDERRLGMRHEGILARRRGKPVYVLARSKGDLPRYMAEATVIDFTGDYAAAVAQLLGALPSAVALMTAPALPARYRAPRRPPLNREAARFRRQMVRLALLIMVAAVCVVLGIVII